jgi:hypothetical protein
MGTTMALKAGLPGFGPGQGIRDYAEWDHGSKWDHGSTLLREHPGTL